MIKILYSILMMLLPIYLDACSYNTINTPPIDTMASGTNPTLFYLSNDYVLIANTANINIYPINPDGTLGASIQTIARVSTFSPAVAMNGNLVAITQPNNSTGGFYLYTFNPANGMITEIQNTTAPAPHQNGRSVAFSPDGSYVTVGYTSVSNGAFAVYDTSNIAATVQVLSGGGTGTYSNPRYISYSPIDSYAIVSYAAESAITNNATARIFEVNGSGMLVNPITITAPAGYSNLQQTVFSPNGQFVAQVFSSGSNGGIVIYSYNNGVVTHIFDQHSSVATTSALLAFSPDNTVVTAAFVGNFRVYRLSNTPTLQQNINVSVSSNISLMYSPNSSFLGATDNAIVTNTYIFSICKCLSITPASLPNGAVGTLYNQALSATNGTAPYTFSIISGTLPNGLSLSGSGIISGNPTQPGTFNFTVEASDTYGCKSTQAYMIIVACGSTTISISPTTLPNGVAGISYSQVLSASDGTSPYTYSITSGSLPTGLSLSSSGTISGTPFQLGTFNFAVTATDSNSCPGSHNYSITIACGNIIISPTSLQSGAVGFPYNQTLNGSNGVAPYPFNISSGSLPNGLSLSNSGIISGTPTSVQLSQFTVNVSDSNGCTRSQMYQIPVNSNIEAIAYINTINTTNTETTLSGQQIILKVEEPEFGIAPFTYSWTSNDPLFVDPQTQLITIIPQNNNQYKATVTDSVGNTFFSNVFTINVNNTSNSTTSTIQSDISRDITGGQTFCQVQAICTSNEPLISPFSQLSALLAGVAIDSLTEDSNNNLRITAFNTNLTQTVSAGNSVQLQITSSIALTAPLTYVLVGSDGSTVTQIDNNIFLVQPQSDTTYFAYITDSNGVQTTDSADIVIRYGTTSPVQGITVTNEGPTII